MRDAFQWKDGNGIVLEIGVEVYFSDHCVSEDKKGQRNENAYYFYQGNTEREFCIDRYQWSLQLPDLIGLLFQKPTTNVRLTAEKNWSGFSLSMKHPLPNGHRYYYFVRPRYLGLDKVDPTKHLFRLSVESAYSRPNPPFSPKGAPNLMFGRLLEQNIRKIKGS